MSEWKRNSYLSCPAILCVAGDEPRSKLEQRDATSGVEDMGPVETVPTDVDVPVGGAGGVAGGGASATAQPPEDSIVQFMWQPLTDMSYPKVTLLASFKVGGSVVSCIVIILLIGWQDRSRVVTSSCETHLNGKEEKQSSSRNSHMLNCQVP